MKLKSFAIGDFILLAASLIWGTAFLFQSVAMDDMGPYTFVTVRGLLATIVLLLILVIRARFMPRKRLVYLGTAKGYRLAILGGFILALAMITQQVGIIGTTTSKAGFITTLYIMFVPLIGIFFRQSYPLKTWMALVLGLIGFYLLSTEGTLQLLNGYDALILLTAFFYGAQIYLIDQLKDSIDSLMFSFIQFGVATLLSVIPTVWLEGVDLTFLSSTDAMISLLYVGIVSSVIAYSLQVVGQKRSSSAPTASLMMSLEGVFATLSGVLFLAEVISWMQLMGMIFILSGIVIAQVRFSFLKKVLLKFKKMR
jgi:drug/metabolite transporter (DMT)-like permease